MSRPTITSPRRWEDAIRRHRLPGFPLHAYRRVAVVAAHPDDETLGAGGLIQALRSAGVGVDVLVATDGEAAYPGATAGSRAELGRVRRAELRSALRVLGAGTAPALAGLPDSAVQEHRDTLAAWLAPRLGGVDACLAPWSGDPHPDHRAVAAAVGAAAGPGTDVWGYPIWQRAWGTPEDPPVRWDAAAAFRLTRDQRARKRAAIGEHRSQLSPVSGAAPVLDGAVLPHFAEGTEVVFRESPDTSTPVARFAERYAADPDPWRTRTSAYERHKRAVSRACLPRGRYGRCLDIACGTGLLTRDLADRCAEVVAVDAVATAVAAARNATAGLRHVTVRQGRVPWAVPPGPFDLVVCSEILYYLGDADLAMTLDAVADAQPTGGDLLAVGWRPRAGDAPRDAADAHRRLLAHRAWAPVTDHAEREFLVLVARRR